MRVVEPADRVTPFSAYAARLGRTFRFARGLSMRNAVRMLATVPLTAGDDPADGDQSLPPRRAFRQVDDAVAGGGPRTRG